MLIDTLFLVGTEQGNMLCAVLALKEVGLYENAGGN
jgi:hypothetical protein